MSDAINPFRRRLLASYPEKRPLIVLTSRPQQPEIPYMPDIADYLVKTYGNEQPK